MSMRFTNITLKDIGMAYRKAKVDLYYMGNPCLLQLLQYEEKLEENLQSLHTKITGPSDDWLQDNGFLGEWTLIPKGMSGLKEKATSVFSDPEDKWRQYCKEKEEDIVAEFRIIAQPSIDFLVFSTLWISKVGYKYDDALSDSAYGSRLRRKSDGELNSLSLGTFSPYQNPFSNWRDGGINTMRRALDEKKDIVAITADVSSFYHELNPDFLLKKEFLDLIGIDLAKEEIELTVQFIKALTEWAKKTPLKKGLPVGLPASAVVANMALIELDQLIQEEAVPLYYGRYVDDIILVMENGSGFDTTEQVWEWLFTRSLNRLQWDDKLKKDAIVFKTDYLINSKICFSNEKNKLFFLEGESGKTLVDILSQQIAERASEWRALPDLPDNPKHIAIDVISVSQYDGETADNLRKADILSMRRSNFAIKLRDFEAYERDLLPATWQQHRRIFLQAFIHHTITLPIFFDLAKYLPRVIRLATACEDFSELRQIIIKVDELINAVRDDCKILIKSCNESLCPSPDELIEVWRKQIEQIIDESIKSSFPARLTREGKQLWQNKFYNFSLLSLSGDIKQNQISQQRLFYHDLAYIPFRFIGLPSSLISRRGISTKNSLDYCQDKHLLADNIWTGLSNIAKSINCHKGLAIPYGLLFATRPFNLTELFFLYDEPSKKQNADKLVQSILAVRGFSVEGKMPEQVDGILNIDFQQSRNKLNIAVASWKTDINSWAASVTKNPDPDTGRYQRCIQLLKAVMESHVDIHYLILPELSLPTHWFMRFARKLHGRGITLISGVEYLHRRKKKVTNQVWAALPHNGLGFPSIMIYRQDKQRPSLHEEQELHRLAGLQLSPLLKWIKPPIIKHGDFQFAMMICSELTNISYRTSLRGEIDALFVPEWNKDTETFNALVESASLDIHTYIIQCNDRQYGDSRIRAPYKAPWMRDIVRLKGGINDYFVVGQIDISALRQFQSSHRSGESPFKPTPDGFHMAYGRKMLPKPKQ